MGKNKQQEAAKPAKKQDDTSSSSKLERKRKRKAAPTTGVSLNKTPPSSPPQTSKSKKGKEPREESPVDDDEEVIEEPTPQELTQKEKMAQRKAREQACIYQPHLYSFEFDNSRGSLLKKDFYGQVTGNPKTNDVDLIIISEGSQVQLYKDSQWYNVRLIHKENTGRKPTLHLSNSPIATAPDVCVHTEAITGIKPPNNWDPQISANRFAILVAEQNAKKTTIAAASPKKEPKVPTPHSMGFKNDHDLLVVMASQMTTLVAGQGELRAELGAVKSEVASLKRKIKEKYISSLNRLSYEDASRVVHRVEDSYQHNPKSHHQD